MQKGAPGAGKPLWISHRGYKAAAVENTAAAFRAARDLGFGALETDLRITSDGAIVLHHDPHLRRLAGIDGAVADKSRAELAKLNLANGGKLFFFDEFIEEFAEATWTFDVKPETAPEVLRALAAWAKDRKATEYLLARSRFLFWDVHHEQLFRELFPYGFVYPREKECWRAGLCARFGAAKFGAIQNGRCYGLIPRVFGISLFEAPVFAEYRARGARILAFLPERDEDTLKAVALGVDEILTNGKIISGQPGGA